MPKLWIDFTALRSRARFEPVLAQYGLTPLGRGPQKTVLCPFHAETEPSCKVNLEKRAFHCFGCGAKGNVLDFVARMETRSCPRRPASSPRSAASRFPRFRESRTSLNLDVHEPLDPTGSPRMRESPLQLGKLPRRPKGRSVSLLASLRGRSIHL